MQDSAAASSASMESPLRFVVSVLLLGMVAVFSPFAILSNNVSPHTYPPAPGWESAVMIYLWAARFSTGFVQERYSLEGGITNLHTLLFVTMALIYLVIQIAVSDRKMQSKYGVVVEIVLFLIWVSICQLIYGTLQDWTLIQVPLLPLISISFVSYEYMRDRRYAKYNM